MSFGLEFLSDEDWKDFEKDMLRVVSRGHFRHNVPASPEDTVQSAIASFLSRRRKLERRELEANTAGSVGLVLLYRAWCKKKEHHRRATYKKNQAANFTNVDPSGVVERSLESEGETPDVLAFVREVLELTEQLPEQFKEVARLCMEGYSSRDIARQLELTKPQVDGILLALRLRFASDGSDD